ncbi:hypothetical protein DLAC_06084 [Tieghemostelium lacteum]|uniref:NmrA-like domain-containing protein n=1 Tax=Tieghemostelium lacteum TaxID=361077 RepID=A0A151ZHE0_TIELA|nr:hypothetical protein DLAC_06084 [Tieghemostelium lacteum]|eukprot:KYQ93401.1 hypothetical protein DLAC_06084 [Tieghemostelium lacteum]
MSDKKLITVLQATSKQSIGVIRSLLKSGKYSVRALSLRGSESIEAKILLKEFNNSKDLEFVKGDAKNTDDLKKVFKGAYGAFIISPNIDLEEVHFEEEEWKYSKIQGDLAAEAGIKHLIFSGMDKFDKSREELRKEFPHLFFVIRDKVREYYESLPIQYVSTVALGYFYTNFIEYYRPQVLEDGTFVFGLPETPSDFPLPYVDCLSAPGPMVVEIFDHPDQNQHKIIPLTTEYLSGNQIAQQFTEVTGIPAVYQSIPKDFFLQIFGDKKLTALKVIAMYEHSTKNSYYSKDNKDIYLSYSKNPNQPTWKQFLSKYQWKGQEYADIKNQLIQ